MPPGEASLRGKDAVRAWVEPIWSKYSVVEISMPSEEIVVIGDWAYERHREMLEIYEVGGIPTKYYLKGVRILRRGEDGSWKIARYIWNGDIRPD
jgi:ketosteroid isomerase-like protein